MNFSLEAIISTGYICASIIAEIDVLCRVTKGKKKWHSHTSSKMSKETFSEPSEKFLCLVISEREVNLS